MPQPRDPQELRARAARMRSIARQLDDAHIHDLHRRAGPDVWVGPTATRCVEVAHAMRHRVTGAADDLRDAARRLDLLADQIERSVAPVPR